MAWNPFGVALELTATGSNVTRISATQYTVKINAAWETYYSGAKTNYGMKVTSGGGTVYIPKFSGNNVSSGSGSFTGTYSISGNGSQTKTISVVFENYNDLGDSKTTTVTFNVTVPAWTSYTVSYNANGGSGAPSQQTKWKDQTLTLSSTKPARTGYTFKGWALSKSDADNGTWYYQAGGSCGKNENLTLYATWEEHKLTVNYYSNYATYAAFKGEEINVSSSTSILVHSQDFYYDNAYSGGLANVQNVDYIYLSRTGYAPTGYWGTSSTGGTLVNHNASFSTGQALAQALGKSLTSGNASVNVYAQWQENSYTLSYDSNGGFGDMSPQTVEWGATFNLSNNTFKREGYKFVGWNAYRNDDDTWYVNGQGWTTEEEILANGYEKKLYKNQDELKFDTSWIKDNEEARLYTMYAIWEISGVVYIDNGTTLEPYLVYIDNGSKWEPYLAYIDNGTDWDIVS